MEEISRVKSQFITNVTHELRSPVNAILELAELMRISCERGYVDQLVDRLSILQSSATNLRSIITNILDLSKMEAGKMEVIVEPFDMVHMLHEVAETTKVLLGNKPVEVQVHVRTPPLTLASDPVKVRQILVNLTSNAAKFTGSGSIHLSAAAEETAILLSVRDTGIGIREEDLRKLFTAFGQLEDAKTKRYEGTGLGLTITRQLTDLLGGYISVTSVYGKGSEFTVRLPLTWEEKDNER